MNTLRLSVSELRSRLKEVMIQVANGERIVIERHSGPLIALVPIHDYLTLSRLDASRATNPAVKENPMNHRIVVTNISGGEGKSTLTREIAFVLNARGYRVALIDTDPQASLTKSLGLHDQDATDAAREVQHTVLPVFETEHDPQLSNPINVDGIDVWVSNDYLYRADPLLAADQSRQGNLRDALDALPDPYDFVLIDTKPGITPLLNAAVAAADHILVPVSGDKGMENLDKLARLVRVAKGFSPNIKVLMFVPNRQRTSTVLGKAVLQDLQSYQNIAPISRSIRDSVVVGEAARVREPLIKYQPRADVTKDVHAVVDDLLGLLGVIPAASPVEVK